MTWLGTKLGPWTLDKTRDLSVDWFKDLILGWDSRYSTVINTQLAQNCKQTRTVKWEGLGMRLVHTFYCPIKQKN